MNNLKTHWLVCFTTPAENNSPLALHSFLWSVSSLAPPPRFHTITLLAGPLSLYTAVSSFLRLVLSPHIYLTPSTSPLFAPDS